MKNKSITKNRFIQKEILTSPAIKSAKKILKNTLLPRA